MVYPRHAALRIHLLSTINRDYVVPFRVMVHSLHRSRRSTQPVTWHIFESGLRPADRGAIQTQLESAAIDIAWYRYNDQRLMGLPIWGRMVIGMYHKMLVPEALPASISRMIYLDADLLVLDAIESLWNTDISGSIIGAVQDMVVPFVSSTLGLSRYRDLGCQAMDPYFNAGMFIVDLDAWREYQVGKKAIEYVHRYERSINLADQDALNAVLHDRWTRVADRWNIIGSVAGRAFFKPKGLDVTRLTAALREPGIVHFAGYLKPWTYRGLGSRWAAAYTDCLLEVLPGFRFDGTAKARSIAVYDRRLRSVLYPLESFAWRMSRHLR
jgi:UDP-glucose/galactose:(glucosyl)LPS alpha-1,2-glucosyl/galactosyltransferase